MGRETPVLLDLKPSGQHYMEDFHAAGGMATLLRELKPLLKLEALTVTGRTLGEEIERAPAPALRRTWCARAPTRSTARRHRGAAGQPGAGRRDHQAVGRRPALMEHEGRAVVFDNAADLAARIDSDDLDVAADDVLVLKNIGPKGAPGMPEAGYLPIPRKLARAGREGHGAHQRRPHERHRLRHRRAARHARVGHRRAAGLGAQRRPHPAERVAARTARCW
jgi:dihydroxy-acid dehydratase